jgi:hypothetical protein
MAVYTVIGYTFVGEVADLDRKRSGRQRESKGLQLMIQKTVIKRKAIRQRMPGRMFNVQSQEQPPQQVECSTPTQDRPQQNDAPRQKE